MLLERGASVSSRNNIGSTPLHLAATNGTVKVIRLLVAAGADVSCVDDDQTTPLHHAVINESIDAARMLLRVGAEPSCRDNSHDTPLHCVAFGSDVEQLVALLLTSPLIASDRSFLWCSNGQGPPCTPLHMASYDDGHCKVVVGMFLAHSSQTETVRHELHL